MNYNLVYTRRADKDIKKRDSAVKRHIGAAILKLRSSPLEHSEKLTDTKIGQYRYRIGDYRVIFDIEGKDIVILRVGHRRGIYRRL
jgi:mRNA interferase RelE/StbE